MSSFLNVSVLVLATMVLVLAGMVGYMYWQQTRIIQIVSSMIPPVVEVDEEEEDDRASVEHLEEVEIVEKVEVPEAPKDDVDDLQTKTTGELKDLLSKKGIPFGKRDAKTVLLQLLKAAS